MNKSASFPLDAAAETPQARMRSIRVQHGLSLRKAASDLGMSHTYLDDLERGRRPIAEYLTLAEERYPTTKDRPVKKPVKAKKTTN
jgi:transcriptional regulator with XRE-family HTH domain